MANTQTVLSIRFLRNQASSVAAFGSDFLSSSYQVIFDSQPFEVNWSFAERTRLEEQLAQVASGTFDASAVEWMAPLLRQFILPKDNIIPNREGIEVLLSADNGSTPLLTNIPWEMASLSAKTSGPEQSLFETTLSRYPFARIVKGNKPNAVPDAQIRALYCISNPLNKNLPPILETEFDQVFDAVLHDFPFIDHRDMAGNHRPSWDLTSATIEEVRPHLLVLVGHGQSGTGIPELLFQEKWIEVSELARALAATKRNVLTVLICCDQVRRAEVPGAQSGALTLVKEGVPGVVAIQGMINPCVAEIFLRTFLNYLLVRPSVSVAAAAGRREAGRKSLQGFLPTVFLNHQGTLAFFHNTLGQYQQELRGLDDFSSTIPDFPRPQLEDELSRALDQSGLLIVRGALGSGKTHLIRKIMHRRLSGATVPSRPIFYIDCEHLAQGGAIRRIVFLKLREKAARHAKLLTESKALPVEDVVSIIAAIQTQRMVVVLDSFSGGRNKSERESWKEFLERAAKMDRSLVVVVTEPRRSLDLWTNLSVPFFRESETREYLTRFVPELATQYKKIHRWSGGSPRLLGVLNTFHKQLRNGPIGGSKHVSPRMVAEVYVREVTKHLSSTQIQTLCNLSYLPRPGSIVWSSRFFDETKNHNALRSLLEAGILDEIQESGHALCHLPGATAQPLRKIFPSRVRVAARHISEQFESWAREQGENLNEEITKLVRHPGGTSVLQAIQAAYLETKQVQKAEMLATLANVPGITDDDLWGIYSPILGYTQESLKRALENPTQYDERLRARLNLLVRASELAQNLGRQQYAESLLQHLDLSTLDYGLSSRKAYDRVVVLKTRAAFLKDTKQNEAIREIEEIYSQALEITSRGMHGDLQDGNESSKDWRELFLEILQERLNTRIFLGHMQADELSSDITELQKEGGDSRHLGLALCKIAERELQGEDKAINWERVAQNLVRAKQILETRGGQLEVSYCLYQYAQYLRRKPQPEIEAALDNYKRAEEAGRLGGDPRRIGLALRHRLALLWQRRDLSGSAQIVDIQEKALQEIDELLPWLERQSGDSLTLRVSERLYTLRAEIGRGRPGDPTERYLQRACRVSAEPLLQAKTDVEHCGRAFLWYLEFLQGRKWFDKAQALLVDFRQTFLEKLQIQPCINDPWQTYDELIKKYGNFKEE